MAPRGDRDRLPRPGVFCQVELSKRPLLSEHQHKNPEDLTGPQRERLERLKRRAGSRLFRAWELKEDLRAVFRAGPEGAAARCSTRGCTTPRTAGYPRSSRWRRRSGAGATTSWRRWAWGSATAAWSRPQRQGQGGGQDGLRVPQRGQPHIPAHAQVLRHQAGPAGAAGGMRPPSTNTNEGSMSMFAWKSGRRAARVARNQTCQDGRLPEG